MTRIDAIRKMLQGNEKILNYLFTDPDQVTDDNGRLKFASNTILKNIGALSSGEQILARVALDIWGGYGNAKIEDIIWRLDADNFRAVLTALMDARKGS